MSTLTATGPQITSPLLTSADRCDRCSAAALVRVHLTSGGTLLFCGHHYAANADALATRQVVGEIHDQRHRIA